MNKPQQPKQDVNNQQVPIQSFVNTSNQSESSKKSFIKSNSFMFILMLLIFVLIISITTIGTIYFINPSKLVNIFNGNTNKPLNSTQFNISDNKMEITITKTPTPTLFPSSTNKTMKDIPTSPESSIPVPPSKIGLTLKNGTDNKTAIMTISNLTDYTSATYHLDYLTSNGVRKKIPGTLTPNDIPFSKNISLDQCTDNKCFIYSVIVILKGADGEYYSTATIPH